MGLYISEEDVKIRLIGKVRFTDDFEAKNAGMHVLLLRRLISEAEGEVEQNLSPRYETPFQTDSGDAFSKLPERPTKNILRTLCELQACMRVLETDFGSGSVVNGDKYAEKLKKRYDEIIKNLLLRKGGKDDEMTGWRFPPLTGLKLAYFNQSADDGYAGMVMVTSRGHGDEPARHINDPEETWTNATFDEDNG